jgi:hypothetical protein
MIKNIKLIILKNIIHLYNLVNIFTKSLFKTFLILKKQINRFNKLKVWYFEWVHPTILVSPWFFILSQIWELKRFFTHNTTWQT